MNPTAIDIVNCIREFPQIETQGDKLAIRVLVSLADSAFKYGSLTEKQKQLFDTVCFEHLNKGF